jgi:putative nucleotidyltransferase with HDIG domain
MPLLDQLKLIFFRRRHPPGAEGRAQVGFLEGSRLVAALIFLATVAAIVLISYVGVTTINLPVLPGQIATVRVAASAPFSYVSAEQTNLSRERLIERVPPVYRAEFAPLQQFETHLHELLDQLEKYEHEFPPNTPSLTNRRQVFAAIVEAFNAKGPYRATVDDVALLLASGDAKTRATLVEKCLVTLREIYHEGVHDQSLTANPEPGSVTVFQIVQPDGDVTQRQVQSLEEALMSLRVTLAPEGTSRELAQALFRIFRNGLTPNIVYDREASQRREVEAVKVLHPVTVSVARGQSIIEPGTRVTPEQYEMLMAHREFLRNSSTVALDEGLQLFGRILLVLAMVVACIVYIRLEDRETLQNNGRLALLALVVIFNLALVRVTYSLLDLDFFLHDSSWASTLPYFAPTALAPLIVAILIDAGSAIFMALFISIFTGVIYGNRLDLQVITFLASIVAIYGCRAVRQRGNVVRAAISGGLIVALFAVLVGVVDQTPAFTLLKQMAAGLLTGVFTGVAVVGLLPVLEALFQRTTDITLLELTDFNHPLLRSMQMETPGTYHHSLVVAQLAENAAAAIGANPLLSRVCALFHDIGKTMRPEFFTENQRSGINPHNEANPELSARIIKGHVTEGVELARKHRLPKVVVDVIEQHHGTTLIRYFYLRAKGGGIRSSAGGSSAPFAARSGSQDPFLPTPAAVPIAESIYRYDGPKPQFKESALIALADSLEAASRSLKQVTRESLGELIDSIFHERIVDGQLDEAPLTYAELAQIKESFISTMLNMLHSRVAYPPAGPVASDAGTQKPPAA